jgi:hypothetical protein
MMEGHDFFDDGFAEQLLLAWAGRSSSFALHAASVARIVEEREWQGAEMRGLTEALDLDDSLEPVRILDVKAGAERLGLRTFGVLRLCRVAPADLLDVPPLLRAGDAGRFVRQMAVIDGAPALWVLDANAILCGAQARRSGSFGAAVEAVESMRGER